MARRKRPSGKRGESRKLLAAEKRRSKRLGYSLTYSRRKREREKSKKYVAKAKALSKLVPELKPLAKKTRLTAAEKAKITRRGKQLRHIGPNLFPVSKRMAKKFKGQLFAPGVQAIPLDNISSTSQLKEIGKDLLVKTNGETWVYWRLERETVRSKSKMKKAAQRAFEYQFPIERVAELAAKAFKRFKIKQIHLWGPTGRVGQGFATLRQFEMWIAEKWQQGRYVATVTNPATGSTWDNPSDPGKWVNGIAIWLEGENELKRKATPEPKSVGKRTPSKPVKKSKTKPKDVRSEMG